LTADGYNDILWDEPDKISDVGFIPPQLIPNGLLFGLIAIAAVFLITMQRRTHMEGWTPIPDVDSKFVR
jgi:hypothetical protein